MKSGPRLDRARPIRVRILLLRLLVALVPVGGLLNAREGIGVSSEFIIDQWQTQDGLPQGTIVCSAQTPDGYLWFGTFGGLVRFDGVRFKVFHADVSPEFSLTQIVAMLVDQRGWLWIQSNDHRVLCLTSEGFVDAVVLGAARGRHSLRGESPDGEVVLHVARDGGENFYRFSRERFSLDESMGSPTEHFFDDPRVSAGGSLWERQGEKWVLIVPRSDAARLSRGEFPAGEDIGLAKAAEDGGVWFSTVTTLRKFRGGRWDRTIQLPESYYVYDLLEMDDGGLLIASRGQLLRVDRAGGIQRVFLTSNGDAPEHVRNLLRDREGNIWVGTDGLGVFRLKRRAFELLGREHGLERRVMRSVSLGSDGAIWALEHGECLSHIDPSLSRPAEVRLKLDGPWCAMAGRDGRVWVGYYGGRVGIYADDVRPPEYVSDPLRSPVQCLFEDSRGVVWLGGDDGMRRIENGRLSGVGLPTGRVRAIAEDSCGNVYAGLAGGGLRRFDGSVWQQYASADGLPGDEVSALCVDEDDRLWMTIDGHGLAFFEKGKVHSIAALKGDLPPRFSWIIPDELGNLWFGSVRGIHRINRDAALESVTGSGKTVHVDHFGRSDGLEIGECSSVQPAVCRARDGRLWVATYGGVVVVDPKRVPANPYPPPVVIERVEFGDRSIGLTAADQPLLKDWGGRVASKALEVVIPPGVRRIEFRYAGLSFTAPQNVRFKYRLEGLDRDWSGPTSARTVAYPHVPPGRYSFQVTACNNAGVWNETGTSMAVVVLPEFWQTLWFKCLLVAAAGVLIWVAYRIRIAQINSVNRLRLRIAGDLHDEIGANLGSIGLNADLLMSEAGLSERQREDLRAICEVTTETTQSLRDIVWFTNPDGDNLAGMVRRMKQVAAVMLAGREWQFEAPEFKAAQGLPLEYRRNLFFIFKEALHNVVKHSQATQVQIVIRLAGGRLELAVADNGCGFDPSAPRPGHGVDGFRRRANEIGGTVRIEAAPGAGAKIVVTVRWRG